MLTATADKCTSNLSSESEKMNALSDEERQKRDQETHKKESKKVGKFIFL